VADKVLNVRVVSPQKVVFQDAAASVVAPAWDGHLGILPGHAPMLALLGAGSLAVDLPGGGSRSFQIGGGVLKVEGTEVTVLTEHAGDELPADLLAGFVIHPEDVA